MKRSERFELRLTPEEKKYIEQASEKRGMTVADFIRSVSVEMARAIALNKSLEEQYHAVIMGVGRVSPEVAIYAATADLSDYAPLYTKPVDTDEENDEET